MGKRYVVGEATKRDLRRQGAKIARSAGLRYVNEGEPGISRKKAGDDFIYILPSGRRLKARGELERIAKLAIPPAYEDVWICPDTRGHIQAMGRDARGRKQYRYHAAWRELRDANKFSRMITFAAILPRLREDVSRDLAAQNLSKRKVVAAVIHLLDKTALRVGNDEYAKANKSYGVTTLRNRHASVNGDVIKLRFRGKGGKEVEIDYRDRRIARVVAKCQDFPGHRLFEFRSDEGAVESITSTDVNEYLREHTGGDFSAKDFRTWHGSLEFALAAAELEKAPKQDATPISPLATALARAAEKLGNTPAICRKCYIHPALMTALAAGRLPAFPSRGSTAQWALSGAEKAMQRFLSKHT